MVLLVVSTESKTRLLETFIGVGRTPRPEIVTIKDLIIIVRSCYISIIPL